MKAILTIKKSPYSLLLLTAIILLFVLVIAPAAGTGFKDKTIFSLPLTTMAWIITLLLTGFWLLYLATNKFLYSSTITWAHVLITVFTTILIVPVLYIGINPSEAVTGRYELIGNAMQLLFVIFVLGQLIYIANVLLGLLGRHKAH